MMPTTLSPYAVNPTAEQSAVVRATVEIAKVEDYLILGVGEEVLRSYYGLSAKWARDVAHQTIIAPPRLLQTLVSLTEQLNKDEATVRQLTTLLHLSVLRIDDSLGHAVRVEGGAQHFCEVVLEQLLSVRSMDYIRSAQELWRRVLTLTENSTDFERWYYIVAVHQSIPSWDSERARRRRLLKRAVMTLGRLTGQLNSPQCYELLEAFLNHPWPEMRDVGAYSLKYWRASSLIHELCSALLLGRDDPDAVEHSGNIFRRIIDLRDPSALPTLLALRTSVFNSLQTGALLQRAIEVCGQPNSNAGL